MHRNAFHQGNHQIHRIQSIHRIIQTNHTFSIEDETFQFGHINYNVEPDQASGLTQVKQFKNIKKIKF